MWRQSLFMVPRPITILFRGSSYISFHFRMDKDRFDRSSSRHESVPAFAHEYHGLQQPADSDRLSRACFPDIAGVEHEVPVQPHELVQVTASESDHASTLK